MRIRISPLDILFSRFIRLRAKGHCERCGTATSHIQCSHFFGRSRKSVRWDEDNAAGLCFGCHQYFTSHPLEHMEWFQKKLDGEFEFLQHRARMPGKPDKELLKIYYQNKIKELEG